MKHKFRSVILGLLIAVLLSSLIFNTGCDKSKGTDNDPTKAVPVASNSGANPEMEKVQAVSKPTAQPEAMEAQKKAEEQIKPAATAPVVPALKKQQASVSAFGDGKLLFSINELRINQDETVFSVTKRAAAQSGTALDCRGFGPAAYITGIGSLKEFDQGPMSGWLYQVNGKTPGVGCGLYKLKAGDRVEWVYTTDGKAAE